MVTHRVGAGLDPLGEALSRHRAGQLDDAARRYQQIAAAPSSDPGLAAEAWQWLGVLRLQQQQPEDARQCLEQALALRPDHNAARLNLGHAHRQLGAADAARTAYAAAAAAPQTEIAAAALAALGQMHLAAGEALGAIDAFSRASARQPTQPAFHEGKGTALAAAARYAEAEQAHRAALALRPKHAGTLNNLGLAVKAQGRVEEALWHFRDALRVDPDCVPALVNLGQAVALTGEFDQATAPLERAVAIAPDDVAARHELAHALASLGRYEDAAAHCEHALRSDPGFADAWQNLGAIRFELGNADDALDALHRALALRPTSGLARFNRASLLLAHDTMRDGWVDYEARHAIGTTTPPRAPLPRWYGAAVDACAAPSTSGFSLSGRTILLDAEQGLGDTLQFFRFAGAVAAHALRVVVAVPPSLRSLLAAAAAVLADNVVVIASDDALPADIDCHCPLLSVPLALAGTADIRPHQIAGSWAPPYIGRPARQTACTRVAAGSSGSVDDVLPWARAPGTVSTAPPGVARRLAAQLRAPWRRPLPIPREPFRIGLAWSGKVGSVGGIRGIRGVGGIGDASETDDPAAPRVSDSFDKRAIPLRALLPLFALPDVEWHVLQRDISAADAESLSELAAEYPLVQRSQAFNDFADTADAIIGLDHLLSVDTSIAHLGGAMGWPVTLLLPFASDWRWAARDGDRSRWYPSITMLDQTTRGQWSDVVQRAVAVITQASRNGRDGENRAR